MDTLNKVLGRVPLPILRQMAHFWGIPDLEKAGRPGLQAGLEAQMCRPQAVRQALRQLDAEEREALRAVLAAGGQAPAPCLTRRYGSLRPPDLIAADPAGLNALERLYRKGLLFRAFAALGNWRGAVLFVPLEMRPYMPWPAPAPAEPLPQVAPEEVTPSPPHLTLHRDVACFLALLCRQDLPEEAQEDGTLRQALEGLFPFPHPAYPHFLLALTQRAGLLAPDMAGTLRPSPEGRQWLRADPWLRTQTLFHTWRDDPRWDDLAAIPELEVERLWPADLAFPRNRVLQHLAVIPPAAWSPLEAWGRRVWEQEPDLLGARPPRIRLRETGERLAGPQSWSQVEGRYLEFLLRGPLHWLGLVQWGRWGEKEVVRRTPLGEALLDQAGRPELADEAIMVEGNFEVWVPVEAGPYATFLLEQFTERVQQDQVSRYRLTRRALHRALERGETVDRLLDLLSRHARDEVPQNVAYTLREWASAYGQLRLKRPLLLLAQEADLLEEVLADPQVRAACGRRIAPTAVEVTEAQVGTLLERLERLGHLPRVEADLPAGQERFSLEVTAGEGAALLALLWAWGGRTGTGRPAQALNRLGERLLRLLPRRQVAWARRQQLRWQEEPPTPPEENG